VNAWAAISAAKIHRAAAAPLALVCGVAALLVGCAAPTPPTNGQPAPPMGSTTTTPAPAPTPPRPAAPVVSPLVAEQRWLDEWFHDTPVAIRLTDSSTLAVDVPLAHAFAAGSNVIKPALGAVLDRVATSLRRQPAMRLSIAAPTDNGAAAALATHRTQRVREHLASHGVVATRMTGLGTARAGTAVQLRMVMTPQPIGRLDDATLPVPTLGVKPVASTPASGVKR
jgi:outer membrane protein OmpA-like peptidoglycan-associated protein